MCLKRAAVCVFCRPTLRKLQPHNMYDIWVRTWLKTATNVWICLKNRCIFSGLTLCFWQDDDVDGEHIVAFAEESDPGRITVAARDLHFTLRTRDAHWRLHCGISSSSTDEWRWTSIQSGDSGFTLQLTWASLPLCSLTTRVVCQCEKFSVGHRSRRITL